MLECDVEREKLLTEEKELEETEVEKMTKSQKEAFANRLNQVHKRLQDIDAVSAESRASQILIGLGFSQEDLYRNSKEFSGGWRMRISLAKALFSSPDLLMLDEPTNHLDAETVQWLEHHLREYAGTVITVTHDRYFLNNVAGWILELQNGEGIPWKGNYASWLDQKHQKMAKKDKGVSEQIKALIRELEWVQIRRRNELLKPNLTSTITSCF